MQNIHKRTIVNRIAEEYDDTQENVKNIIDVFTENMVTSLSQGRDIEFRRFGVFRVKTRPERMGINPKTQEKVHIDETKHVHFKMGSKMKKLVED